MAIADPDPIIPRDAKSPLLREQKVIVKMSSGEVIKGYIEFGAGADLMVLLRRANTESDGAIALRAIGKDTNLEIRLADIESAFFVKSFRGTPERKDVRFYSNGPLVETIWAEIRFHNKEVLECLIENTGMHLLGPGIIVKPTDPGSNNSLIYISNAAIASYRVLGVRGHRPKAAS